jgi:hypothetical protein
MNQGRERADQGTRVVDHGNDIRQGDLHFFPSCALRGTEGATLAGNRFPMYPFFVKYGAVRVT